MLSKFHCNLQLPAGTELGRHRLHSAARTKIVATFVYASSQGQRTHSAQTKNVTAHKVYTNLYALAHVSFFLAFVRIL